MEDDLGKKKPFLLVTKSDSLHLHTDGKLKWVPACQPEAGHIDHAR